MAKKTSVSVKLDPKRNPYVAGMRFRKAGRHLDKRREANKNSCRQWKPE